MGRKWLLLLACSSLSAGRTAEGSCPTLIHFLHASRHSARARSRSDDLAACITELCPSTQLLFPGSDAFNASARGLNARFDAVLPLLVVNVSSKYDISAAVRCAGLLQTEVVPMNGGHSFDGFSSTLGLLLHLDGFSDVVSVDVDAGTIEVQAGMRLGRLYGVVIELNRLRRFGDGSSTHALPVGTFATVGVVGHVLCGGYGVLGRQLGWASDNVVRFELVNASGDIFAVSAEQVRARVLVWFGVV